VKWRRNHVLSVLPLTLSGSHFLDVGCGEGIDTCASCEQSRPTGSINRVLKPTGKFAFTLPHPCFDAYGATRSPWLALIADWSATIWPRVSGVQRIREASAEPTPDERIIATNPHRAALPPFVLVRPAMTSHPCHESLIQAQGLRSWHCCCCHSGHMGNRSRAPLWSGLRYRR
jgi:hypothetical protein